MVKSNLGRLGGLKCYLHFIGGKVQLRGIRWVKMLPLLMVKSGFDGLGGLQWNTQYIVEMGR